MAREVTLADIKFEQASVLYNIGALHSILGSMETRTNADVFHPLFSRFSVKHYTYSV